MRQDIVRGIAAAVAFAVWVSLGASGAVAAPPDAVSTATPTIAATTAATPTAVSTELAAPVTPTASMHLSGPLWINARPAGQSFAAFIGDLECAHEDSVPFTTDGGGPIGNLTVPAAAAKPGCGTPGAIVHFTIDGRPANETVAWAANANLSMRFTVGPPFAIFSGTFRHSRGGLVVPLIHGIVCGEAPNLTFGGVDSTYEVVVDPDALHPGCGISGAIVRFGWEVFAGDGTPGVIVAFADQTAVWQPNDELTLDLTFSGANALPPTGTGTDRSRTLRSASLWLAAAGLLLVGTGFATRRHTLT
jgi:hypothetical protein